MTPDESSRTLRSSFPEELDPIKSLSIDKAPKERANIWAAVDIARKYLGNKEGYYDDRDCYRMLEGLQDKVFPGLSNVEMRDILERNGWPNPIITPNTNDDPNDKDDFNWYVTLRDGTVERALTEREEYAKSHREAKEKEDPIERYCYDIRGVVPWYDITFDERKKLEARRSETKSSSTETSEEQLEDQQFDDATGTLYRLDKPEGMSDKEWAAKKREARKLLREIKKQNQDDFNLKYYGSSTGIFIHRVDKLRYMCYCAGNDMRHGRICKICKLTKKVDEYMLNLFKDAAEGRGPSTLFS